MTPLVVSTCSLLSLLSSLHSTIISIIFFYFFFFLFLFVLLFSSLNKRNIQTHTHKHRRIHYTAHHSYTQSASAHLPGSPFIIHYRLSANSIQIFKHAHNDHHIQIQFNQSMNGEGGREERRGEGGSSFIHSYSFPLSSIKQL